MKAPDLAGMPGALVKGVEKVKTATQIFPPPGVGLGAGIGVGCGFGWPLRRAYGPPRGLCGPAIAVGVGFGYGQGFGRRFGKDERSKKLTTGISNIERTLDAFMIRFLVLLGLSRDGKVGQQLAK